MTTDFKSIIIILFIFFLAATVGGYSVAYILTDGTMQVNKEKCGNNDYWKCLLKGNQP